MKQASEEQARKFAGVFVEHFHLLEQAPKSGLQWAIQYPEDAIKLFNLSLTDEIALKRISAGELKQLIPIAISFGNKSDAKPGVEWVVVTYRDLVHQSTESVDIFTQAFCAQWRGNHLKGWAIEPCDPYDMVGPFRCVIPFIGKVLWKAIDLRSTFPSESQTKKCPIFIKYLLINGEWFPMEGSYYPNPFTLDSLILFRLRKM